MLLHAFCCVAAAFIINLSLMVEHWDAGEFSLGEKSVKGSITERMAYFASEEFETKFGYDG